MRLLLERAPARSLDLSDEISWARGSPVSREFIEPPPWVRPAVLRTLRGPMKSVLEFQSVPSSPSPELWGKAEGVLLAASALFAAPSTARRGDETKHPELRELREKMGEVAGRISTTSRAGKRPKVLRPKIETLEDVQAHIAGTHAGALLVSEPGDADFSLTDRLCFLLWLLWPEASTAKNRRELHAWIAELGVLTVGFRLVEKLCREIGFAPAKRGRPKNKPTSRR